MTRDGLPPLYFRYELFLILIYSGIVLAQGPCESSSPIIQIMFRELDPPGVPALNDRTNYQPVLNSELQPFSFRVNPDPDKADLNQGITFDEYFTISYLDSVDPMGVYIQIIKGIDRDGPTANVFDDKNILQYQLECRSTSTSSIVFRVLKIQIIDVNDNAPIFQGTPYSFSVNEFDGTSKFGLPSGPEGIVSVAGALDFEELYQATGGNTSEIFYGLTVIATDLGNPPRSSTTTLTIRIEDGDDQPAEFVYPSCIRILEQFSNRCVRPKYFTSIPAGSDIQTNLVFRPEPADPNDPTATVDIIMQDRDTLNSQISCSIIQTLPSGYANFFSASASYISGKQYRCDVVFRAGNPLNRTAVPNLEIIIEAMESNTSIRRRAFATIALQVVQTNAFDPVITAPSTVSTVGYIYENSLAGALVSQDQLTTTLLQLTFSDPDLAPTDPTPQFDISVSPGVPFRVTQNGFIELSTPPLDFQMTQFYNFQVTITERTPERRSASIALRVNVLDLE